MSQPQTNAPTATTSSEAGARRRTICQSAARSRPSGRGNPGMAEVTSRMSAAPKITKLARNSGTHADPNAVGGTEVVVARSNPALATAVPAAAQSRSFARPVSGLGLCASASVTVHHAQRRGAFGHDGSGRQPGGGSQFSEGGGGHPGGALNLMLSVQAAKIDYLLVGQQHADLDRGGAHMCGGLNWSSQRLLECL